ncbi:MAG: aldolase [Candidatus Riflebacteria bacterium]|nr:aldolase [Candidatus Riflebacteria bacterium]
MQNDLRAFQNAGRDLFLGGLNNTHSGNMSARLNRMIVITRTGSMLHRLEHGDLIETLLDGEDSNTKLASRELPVHRAIYKSTKTDAVIHAHCPFAVALSLYKDHIQPIDIEGCYYFPNGIPVLAVKEAVGSTELAEAISPLLLNNKIVVVRGHGTFSTGVDLEECLHWTSCLDNIAKIILLADQYSQKK